MLKTFANKVRRSFSDAADQYDILTSLHKEIGRELVKKHVKVDAARVLDVGCGTGYVANKAKFFFPESLIVGLDIAEGMLIKAKELHEGIPIEWLQADAGALPFKNQIFDLVYSNLAYQWSKDLSIAFKEARRVLSPGGTFSITMFGFRTCEELFSSFEQCVPGQSKRLMRLPTVQEVTAAMQKAGFAHANVDYELIKVQFSNITELLGWLKNIGANNLSKDFFLGKQMLNQLNEYYRGHFPYHEGISASFEVIWVCATA